LACRSCGVRLTDENWCLSCREKRDYLCSDCLAKRTADWRIKNRVAWLEWHRNYQHSWRRRNKDIYRARERRRQPYKNRVNKELKNQVRLKLIAKLGGCCYFCEEPDIRVLRTHHWNGRNDKRGQLKKREGGNPFKLLKDSSDIVLLCANCHARLHFKQKSYRFIMLL